MNRNRIKLWLATILLGLALATIAATDRIWNSLATDQLHDTSNPSVGMLQQPAEALIQLPADSAGNQVDWAAAIEDGYISPRTSLRGEEPMELLGSTILMKNTGDAPFVLFPHLPHSRWLSCSNCHEEIFKSEVGATPITMLAILQGQYCGQCHGAVAFPLTECNRCHSVDPGNAAHFETQD
jgi:c(7)-type cytochrome triheme protein